MGNFCLSRIVLSVFLLCLSALTVQAQTVVPEFRYFVTPDMDFYGSDLDAQFDTSLGACERACSANAQCKAFTFNSRSNSCFPKSEVSDKTPYEGAVSAEKRPTAPGVRKQAQARAGALAYLGQASLDRAHEAGRDIGFWHRAGAFGLQQMIDAARAQEAAGNLINAMRWTGGAISASDQADLWADYARLNLAIQTDNASDRRRYVSRAERAAINAYLRSPSPGGQVSALLLLSQALERNSRGRDMIPTLRLAETLQARDDVTAALDEAIRKYGFRVEDTEVESDVAAPRVCAEFNEPLVKAGVDYEPFVQFPVQGVSVQASGRSLCIDGVEHGKRYTFTLRQGLPAASGEVLHRDTELTLYVRDRSPAVRFPGRAYVLPKAADAALPVETVNTATLDLTLRRVSDRNLLRAMQNQYFGRPLSEYQERHFANEIGEDLWTGTADVSRELNRDVTTRLPMGEVLSDLPTGIYALTAAIPGADPYDDPGATQWFVLSDLGLTTMDGNDGLHVMVRGLSDAAPRAGVTLTLVSRANAVLGTAQTDADGMALFEPGLMRGGSGSAPAVVFAELGDSDIGFLSLTDPGFDLSDRGVEGRAPAGPVDVFLTTDRGAYRAGETIHATVLARDPQVDAVEGLPLIAILSRPDGVEYSRNLSDGGKAGGHVFALPVGATVPRGSWTLAIKSDPDGPALAETTLLVEDFLPERIDFDMALAQSQLRPGDAPTLTLDVRYLFGAPGAGLEAEGDLILRPVRSVEDWPGYRFGRHDDRTGSRRSYFSSGVTDAQGRAEAVLDVPAPSAPGMPLQALIRARVSDGARPVERDLTVPVLPDGALIGIKPLFEDVVAEGTEAAFSLIGLDQTLALQPMQVKWTLNRVRTQYQWYQQYGSWNWEPITRRTRIAGGQAALGADPVTLSTPVDWGQYELVVERADGDYAASSVDFYAGWYVPADGASTPDRLELSLDRPDYRAGDTAQLRIVPRFAGTALVTVMADSVISRQAVEVTEGENLIPVAVTQDWGTGAYVTATVIRPMDVAAGQNPARAIGLAYAAVDPEGRKLQVTLDAPEVADPRQTQRVGVSVAGAQEGSDVWLTVAAVDVGILNLTAFDSPDPSAYYFGQRRLGVELRDVYGRLIDGMNGAMGAVRSGGDANGGAGLQSPPPTQELMAVFSGPVQTDANGQAYVDIDLPAFNGTVRLMAVAWTRQAVGQAEQDMIVRDPVVVTATVPRFLAPGDRSRVMLEVVHADGPSGQMQLAFENTGAGLSLGAAPGAFDLGDKAKAVFAIPVSGEAVGDPSFDVVLTTPDGRALRQTLTLPVRANDSVVSTTRRFTLASGDTFTFSKDVFADLRTGTGSALISAGPLARFDAPGLLSALDRYPYGCTEQVTSRALPLLYLSSVAQASGLGDGPDVKARIEQSIDRILSRQAPNGAFGLWAPASGDFWLDAYVTDFLSRARAEGYIVPDRAFRSAVDNLRNRISYAPDFDHGGEDVAYALLVLAREGAAAMGDLRYYADIKGGAFATPMAAAQLGAALAAYGDQTRADGMFTRASGLIADQRNRTEYALWRADYGTHLRDEAGLLALATEAGSQVVDADGLLTRVSVPAGQMSTQEAAWSLLAAQALLQAPESAGLLVDGAPVSGPFVRVLQDASPDAPMAISAASGRETAITLTTLGVPTVAPPAGGSGYAITRQYYSMEGVPLPGDRFAVGDRFVTVLTVTPFDGNEARLMIDDPLPAGIEIDNPSLMQSGDVAALDWLDISDAAHAEFRADRFLGAVDLRGQGTVTLAYVARAVSPGEFHHPAAAVEDMYRPTLRARTDTGRVTVTE